MPSQVSPRMADSGPSRISKASPSAFAVGSGIDVQGLERPMYRDKKKTPSESILTGFMLLVFK
jgi:hypothetical protein